MRRAAATVLATAALTAGLCGPGVAVASANIVGDSQTVQYPGSVAPGGNVLPDRQAGNGTTTRARVSDDRATLPFTGGELVALVTAGAGAVGAGAALVVATRRRSPQSA